LSTAFRLLLPRQIYTALLEQARAELPNESCGLLAGRIDGAVGQVERCYPLVNQLASPKEYESEDRGLFNASKDMRQLGIDLLAVYHSHPTSEPVPSRRDLERNYYGSGIIHLIVSLATSGPPLRAWRLSADSFAEAEWEMCEETDEPPRPAG
jgi:proteasome lid subunit RPN8/RPN11